MSRFADYVMMRFPDPAATLVEFFSQMQEAAASVGASIEVIPILDGGRHYLASLNGQRDKRHYYRADLHHDSDGTVWPSVTFGTFKHSGATAYFKPRDLAWQCWESDSKGIPQDIDDTQRQGYKRAADKLKADAEIARQKRNANIEEGRDAATVAAITAWDTAEPANTHPYLSDKAVRAYGLRIATASSCARLYSDEQGKWLDKATVVTAGDLLIPVTNVAGKIINLQRITSTGQKRFLIGGQKKGGFFRIPGEGMAFLVEGYATGATVHEATGKATIIAFDAGNLSEVASSLNGQIFAVAADNDANNAGQSGAEATALPYVIPPEVGSDWNDYAAQYGLDTVCNYLNSIVKSGVPAVIVPDAKTDVDIHNMTPVLMTSWPHVSHNGQPLNTIPNLERLLENYEITVRYNVIRKDIDYVFPGKCGTADNQNQVALNTITSLCALNRLPKADVPAYLLSVADRHLVNPVMDFITVQPWDGQSRFSALLNTIETRNGFDRDLCALLVRRWLISAVAAAAMPSGFWSKGVLVFQGEQSLGKTAWIRSLLPPELRDLVKIDAQIDPDNKDTIISAVSHWLVEIGELDGTLRKADIAKLKGFISKDRDQFRRPYGRAEEKFQRRTVFFASVNPERFLADDTGNVRWWTVPVTGVNYEHDIDTQQLWAEVYEWFKVGERWWLNREEERCLEAMNADHQQVDPVEEMILAHYEWGCDRIGAYREKTATDVLKEIGYDKPNKSQSTHVSNVLRRLTGGDPRKARTGRFFNLPPRVLPTGLVA